MKKLLTTLAALSLLSACADGRFEAWKAAESARATNRRPTLEIVSYQADGRTPASSTIIDLSEFSPGGGRASLPKGVIAESLGEATGLLGTVLSAPTSIVLGVGAALGQVAAPTTINNESGSVALGSGTASGETTSFAPPPEEEVLSGD